MKRFNSFHSINIFTLELDNWEYEVHKHNFYEMIYVDKGKGMHYLNDISFPFKRGDVFLLTPDDSHEFRIDKPTKFIYLKFTEQVFLEKLNTNNKTHWEETLKNALLKVENLGESIIKSKQDSDHIYHLLKIMLYEFTSKALFNNEIVLELFGSVMAIVTRHLNHNKIVNVQGNKEVEKINNILTYIRINAFDNDKMDIKKMAAHFYMSPNYISIYVKKHTDLSIQQHINQTKLKAAEKLLKQNRFTVNEIAERLGYNDASHFNKMFKKYKEMNPSDYGKY
jgi:AraC family transcriptional regulator, L-rhamnose operon regulatory protein RhaS